MSVDVLKNTIFTDESDAWMAALYAGVRTRLCHTADHRVRAGRREFRVVVDHAYPVGSDVKYTDAERTEAIAAIPWPRGREYKAGATTLP